MNRDRSFGEVHLDIDAGRTPREDAVAPSEREAVTCRIAICGDFSGRATSEASGSWRIDRDDFDDVLASVAPTLTLDLPSGTQVAVHIRELDDFHPDQLFAQIPQFASLRELRSRLEDPSTFRRAAAEITAPAPRPKPASLASGSLLDVIVGDASPDDAPSSGQRPATDDLHAFIQRSMAPLLVERPDPRQAELLAQADGAITALMREVLHHPAFQALESLWRGVFRMVRHVDTDEHLQIHLLDVSRSTFVSDLANAHASATPAHGTALYTRLNARAPRESGGWGILVAHFGFGGQAPDLAALQQLADVGAALDAPWLAEATPDLAMGESSEQAADAWQHLRQSQSGRYLGLALPRVLLRLPYGHDTDATERFRFEELEHAESHASYLWGNPAVFCATLLAQGFSERGRGLAVGSSSNLDGLPLHLVRRDGVTTAKPCAEVVMGEEDAITLLESGFIPMCTLRDQDVVRVPRIQSVAQPTSRLAGRLAQ